MACDSKYDGQIKNPNHIRNMNIKQTIHAHFADLGKFSKCFTAFLSMLFLMSFLGTGQAVTYFWDPQGAAGPSDGSGNWDDTTVSNWWNGSSLTTYTTNSDGSAVFTNVVIGAGVPGTYNITNINPVTAYTLTFSNAGNYTISGNLLAVNVNPAETTYAVVVSLSNTTNTIATTGGLGFQMNQGNDISNAPNSMLTLASGLTANGGNPRFTGVNQSNSIVNLTGGTVTDSSVHFHISGAVELR